MWGFANVQNRLLGLKIYDLITCIMLRSKYKQNNKKQLDQLFLIDRIASLVDLNKTTQHDSYNCLKFPNSQPFPTRRPSNKFCFVSCFYDCCDEKLEQKDEIMMPICKFYFYF
jgi:hypothetical protein